MTELASRRCQPPDSSAGSRPPLAIFPGGPVAWSTIRPAITHQATSVRFAMSRRHVARLWPTVRECKILLSVGWVRADQGKRRCFGNRSANHHSQPIANPRVATHRNTPAIPRNAHCRCRASIVGRADRIEAAVTAMASAFRWAVRFIPMSRLSPPQNPIGDSRHTPVVPGPPYVLPRCGKVALRVVGRCAPPAPPAASAHPHSCDLRRTGRETFGRVWWLGRETGHNSAATTVCPNDNLSTTNFMSRMTP